jgi:hypothetical protein
MLQTITVGGASLIALILLIWVMTLPRIPGESRQRASVPDSGQHRDDAERLSGWG